MTSVPSILSSAQSLMNDGFSRMDRAAANLATAETTTPSAGDQSPVAQDPVAGAIVGVIQARGEVNAAATLMRTYERTSDDLLRLTTSYPHDHQVDGYA